MRPRNGKKKGGTQNTTTLLPDKLREELGLEDVVAAPRPRGAARQLSRKELRKQGRQDKKRSRQERGVRESAVAAPKPAPAPAPEAATSKSAKKRQRQASSQKQPVSAKAGRARDGGGAKEKEPRQLTNLELMLRERGLVRDDTGGGRVCYFCLRNRQREFLCLPQYSVHPTHQ